MLRKVSVGEQIDSYCTKCRLNLGHIITAMADGNIIRVKCNTCGNEHRYRGMDTIGKLRAGRSSSPAKKGLSVADKAQAVWETCIDGAKGSEVPYDIAKSYNCGDIVVHTLFGKGVVRKTLFRKCEVLFKDKERLLASANG
jgi:ribosomal protein S27E